MFQRSKKETQKWEEWFAWYPVKLRNGKRTLFKKILRRGFYYSAQHQEFHYEYQEKMGETEFIKSKSKDFGGI